MEAMPQPPKRPSVAASTVHASERKPAGKSKLELANETAPEAAPSKHGFDPYNSGAFNRRDTWSKVIRK
jgi:hypothetical protein